MMFTDGGEDRAQDIFEKYNWPNKTVSLSPEGCNLLLYSLLPVRETMHVHKLSEQALFHHILLTDRRVFIVKPVDLPIFSP